MFQMHAPLDPECPEVVKFYDGFWEDPITTMSGCGGEISDSWESKHRSSCKQCQEFGAANMEVIDGR